MLLSLLRVSIALKPKRAKPYKKLQYIQQILLYQINEIKDLQSQGLSNNIVATKTGISRRAVDKLRLNIDLFNQLYLSFVKKGPIRKLSKEQEDFVLDYLRDRPTVYRSEIQQFLYDEFDVVISKQRISEIIIEREFSRKAAQRIATEQNPILYVDYKEKIRSIPVHRVYYVNKSTSNKRTRQRKYGFSAINILYKDQGSTKRSKRQSVLLAITTNGYLDNPLIF